MKHYAIVAVVAVPDRTLPETVWEGVAAKVGSGALMNTVYLGDPFRIPDERQSDEYATVSIALVGDGRDPVVLTLPSALEGGDT